VEVTALADVVEGRARWHVALCDCRFALAGFPDACVDAIVCDPPYELGFMGKKWDRSGIAYDVGMWREVLRIAKPGAHMLAFGGTRTSHRMVAAIEDAGWEVRDSLCWLYGSGFPKSLNVAKQLDKLAGHWRGKAGEVVSDNAAMGGPNYARTEKGGPITAAAAAAGYGTALKPAFEPVCLARKPLNGTVAANFQGHGTGALNIDGCRIAVSPEDFAELSAGVEAIRARGGSMENSWKNSSDLSGANPSSPLGRWPANVVMDEEAAALLDQEAGDRPGMTGGGLHSKDYAGGIFGKTDARYTEDGYCLQARGDNGGPSRFFYTAKAPRSEKEAGLETFAHASGGEATGRKDGSPGAEHARGGAGGKNGARNTHPTVKPVELMRWLVRLVARPGALVLDPFCGSGSTGVATMLEGDGRRFVAIELDPLHVDFARARIAHVIGGNWEREVPEKRVEPAQPSLFDEMQP
jgi:site-specific DNA-methyltransferase (adenine-specific)